MESDDCIKKTNYVCGNMSDAFRLIATEAVKSMDSSARIFRQRFDSLSGFPVRPSSGIYIPYTDFVLDATESETRRSTLAEKISEKIRVRTGSSADADADAAVTPAPGGTIEG